MPYLDTTGLKTLWTKLKSTFALASHKHAASDITSGTLSIARGGTGATTASAARSNLGAAATSHNHAASNITSGTIAAARLPLATTSAAGAIKVGDGLSISNGVLSATAGSTSKVNDLIGQSCVDFRTLNAYSTTYGTIMSMHDYGVATIETAAASARTCMYTRISADTTTLPAGRYKLVLVCDDTSVEDLICYETSLAKDYIHVAMTVVDSTGANNNPDTWLAFALVNGVTPTTSIETTRTVTDTFTLDADTQITAYIWLPITTTAIPRYRLGFAIERLLPEVKPTSVTVNINFATDGYTLGTLEDWASTNDNSYSFAIDLSDNEDATWRKLLNDGVLGADTPGYPQLLNYYNTTYLEDIRESTRFETAGYPDFTDHTLLQSTQTMALTTTGYGTSSNGVALIRLTNEPETYVQGDNATPYYAPFSVDDAVDGYGTDTLYFALAIY